MKIRYASGGTRQIEQDIDLVIEKLSDEFGPDFVHANGLIWENDGSSENDDGANAVAELLSEEDQRLTDLLPES